jgi:hypothetical protein
MNFLIIDMALRLYCLKLGRNRPINETFILIILCFLCEGDCLGTYCDYKVNPHLCSPKALRHVQNSGNQYFSDPYLDEMDVFT